MRKLILVLAAVAFLGLAGCAAQVNTFSGPPLTSPDLKNQMTFNAPFEEVWQAAIQSIGAQFFMIDNIEIDSKIITLAFSVDNPDQYIDCGMTTVSTSNSSVDFPFAQGHTIVPTYTGGYQTMNATRTATLEGKVNVVFNEISNQTTVSVNTRYVLTVNQNRYLYIPGGWVPRYIPTTPDIEIISFNGGQDGTGTAVCRSRFTLEQLVFDGIQERLR